MLGGMMGDSMESRGDCHRIIFVVSLLFHAGISMPPMAAASAQPLP